MTSASNLRLVNKNVPPAAPFLCVPDNTIDREKPLERKEGNRGQPLLESAFKLCGKWSNRRSPPTSTYTKCVSLISGTSTQREKRKLRKISSRFHSGLVFYLCVWLSFAWQLDFYEIRFVIVGRLRHGDTRFGMQGFPFFSFPVKLLIGKQARERGR